MSKKDVDEEDALLQEPTHIGRFETNAVRINKAIVGNYRNLSGVLKDCGVHTAD